MSDKGGPLAQQIAASIEDVKALLDSNHSLSVNFLHRRLCDLEEEVRRRFLHVKGLETAMTKLDQRLDQAAVKFQEMREELDTLKAEQKNKA